MPESAIQVRARGNFLDVEALYQGIVDIRSAAWVDSEALLMMANSLEAALSELPVYDPNTGQALAQVRSFWGAQTPAKQVAVYFRRAATLPGAIASELAGAWSAFDTKILKPAELAAGITQRPQRTGTPSFTGVPTPQTGPQRRGRRSA